MIEKLLAVYNWVQLNGVVLIGAILGILSGLEVLVRLTPTKVDDGVIERIGSFVRHVCDIFGIPNNKAGGGSHPDVKDVVVIPKDELK